MSQTIQILDKHFEPLISSDIIQKRIIQLAEMLNQNYHNKEPLFLPILNGSFIFAADLLKNFLSPCEVSFVKMSSYQGSKSKDNVTMLLGLDKNLKDRSIIIVDGIIETGNTIVALMDALHKMEPKKIEIVSCFVKPETTKRPFKIDYKGFEIGNDFVVGYGLDYGGVGRNLKGIYKICEK